MVMASTVAAAQQQGPPPPRTAAAPRSDEIAALPEPADLSFGMGMGLGDAVVPRALTPVSPVMDLNPVVAVAPAMPYYLGGRPQIVAPGNIIDYKHEYACFPVFPSCMTI